jgi:hypothetical protein
MKSLDSVVSGPGMKQDIMAGGMWQTKAAHFMEIRKQRDKRAHYQ